MDKPQLILLVEDNPKILTANTRILQAEGYHVATATTLAEARRLLVQQPDLIILDLMMPDGNGLDFIAEIRNSCIAPVLLLTALAEKQDRLLGLRAGGDDYITKPYDIDELCARVSAFLRRDAIYRSQMAPFIIEHGSIRLDTVANQAFCREQNMLLAPKEFAMLHYFIQHEEQLVTNEQLYIAIWKQPLNNDVGAVKTCISRLRTKLNGSGFHIVVQRGKGYYFGQCPTDLQENAT